MPTFSCGKFTYMRLITIGDRIRSRRVDNSMTQTDLGRAVGVSRAAVSQWESGETKGLRPDNLLAVAKKLETNIEWIISGKGDPNLLVNPSGGGALSREEEILLAKYRALSRDDRTRMQAVVSALDATHQKVKRHAKK